MEPIITLRQNLSNLSERDQAFALSLMASRTLSAKQHHWIAILAERATTPKLPARPDMKVGDITPIVRLIEQAKSKLKWPALVIGQLRISVAGPASRAPGSITVTDVERDPYEGRRKWMGRITTDGRLQCSTALNAATQASMLETLTAFAADPVGEARKQGHRTGHCCFCQRKLDDERSTALGFGPVCAKTWGLAWDKKAAKLVCEEAGA